MAANQFEGVGCECDVVHEKIKDVNGAEFSAKSLVPRNPPRAAGWGGGVFEPHGVSPKETENHNEIVQDDLDIQADRVLDLDWNLKIKF